MNRQSRQFEYMSLDDFEELLAGAPRALRAVLFRKHFILRTTRSIWLLCRT